MDPRGVDVIVSMIFLPDSLMRFHA
jgi:hypothetical protein